MLGSLRGVVSSVLCRCTPSSTVYLQPARTGVMMRRMYPPRLYKQSQTGPFRPKLRRREYVYMMEDDTNWTPAGDMDVILTTDIEGLGFEGDVVSVAKRLARNHMLPVGVAEYATPDNVQKYERIRQERQQERRQTLTACKTMKQLEHMTLPVPMSSSVPWTLNKTHVKVAFRMVGVHLCEDVIELSNESVTQPGEVTLHVTVNAVSRVAVRALIYAHNKSVVPSLPTVWSTSPDAKFNIHQVISQAAHRMRGLTYSSDTDRLVADGVAQ